MNILITNYYLNHFAGSELFTFDLANELMRRGHRVFVYSPLIGAVAEKMKSCGMSVTDDILSIKDISFDIIHAQHNITAILARSVFPDVPLVFMSHGKLPELEQIPSVDIGISKYIVVSEEIADHIKNNFFISADRIEIVRNFVDTKKFYPKRKISDKPKKILVISNHFSDEMKEQLQVVADGLEINLKHIGLPNNPVQNVEKYIDEADIIVTLGRGALESMACERNVIVYDMHGGDGMVTEDNFYELRKNNFSGRRFAKKYSEEDLKNEILKYDSKRGSALRKIIQKENSMEEGVSRIEKIYETCRGISAVSQIKKNQLFNELSFLNLNIFDCRKNIELKNEVIETQNQKIETQNQKIETQNQKIERIGSELLFVKSSKFWKLRNRYLYLKNGLYFALFSPKKLIYKYVQYLSSNECSFCEFLKIINPAIESNYNKKLPKVDIIIPVYNGFEFLELLFGSIFENTIGEYRLIIIDDCSPDDRIDAFLQNIKIQNVERDIILVKNKKNMGFAATVNYAFDNYVKRDFILLNTDVEVPKGWNVRLMHPILFEKKIASVTPFTNSGAQCSFPLFFQNNEIFEGMTVNEIDKYFQMINLDGEYIDILTGVGFCMGVNKKVADQIGLFDVDSFGRGYGEESDWCVRASKKGYRNVIASNLFVYHKHGGSFDAKEKNELSKKNLQIFFNKYPKFKEKIEKFTKLDPLKKIRNAVIIMSLMNLNKKNKLYYGVTNDNYDNFLQKNKSNKDLLIFVKINEGKKNAIFFKYEGFDIKYSYDDLAILIKFLKMFSVKMIIVCQEGALSKDDLNLFKKEGVLYE